MGPTRVLNKPPFLGLCSGDESIVLRPEPNRIMENVLTIRSRQTMTLRQDNTAFAAAKRADAGKHEAQLAEVW